MKDSLFRRNCLLTTHRRANSVNVHILQHTYVRYVDAYAINIPQLVSVMVCRSEIVLSGTQRNGGPLTFRGAPRNVYLGDRRAANSFHAWKRNVTRPLVRPLTRRPARFPTSADPVSSIEIQIHCFRSRRRDAKPAEASRSRASGIGSFLQ